MEVSWPNTRILTQSLLNSLVNMGGSATAPELDKAVIKAIGLSDDLVSLKRSGNRGEINYRLAWVRTKAKQNGLITKGENRLWSITDKGRDFKED